MGPVEEPDRTRWQRVRPALARARPALARAGTLASRWLLRIALPLICMDAMLRAFPYRADVAGVPFKVQATLVTRRGLSADTTFGNWEFPHFDGLPVGIHISPVNVDLLRLRRQASPDTAAFVDQLKAGFTDQVPRILLWLAFIALVGICVGLAASAALNMAARYVRRLPRRDNELRLRVRQFAAAVLVVVAVGAYGALSFNSDWTKQSRLTGTLGALQLFPDQLDQFYGRQSKVYDVLGAVAGIQDELQKKIDQRENPETAFNIMYVSDMHLAGTYPLIEQYIKNFDVKLIVNTGDESEFGTAAEMTSSYVASIAAVTSKVPMIWVPGNHDSPATERVMRSIKGVHVLGSKTAAPDGSIIVTGSDLDAYGLTIAGVGDPRVYGGPGRYGSDDDAVTNPLEREAMDSAVAGVSKDAKFDIFATHEPSAAQQLAKDLPGQIRQLNSGHTHKQNATDDIQSGGPINLVEGSTGAGGLDNINRGQPRPPIEFSIESVAPNCQFTKLLRFQLADPVAGAAPSDAAAAQDDVSVSTVYLTPQKIAADRVCGTAQGIGRASLLEPARTQGSGR